MNLFRPLQLLRLFFRKEAPHLALGKWGERQAARAVRKQGFTLLGRRVRVGKHDEIDLLARDGNILVIVEVKTRSSEGERPPRDSVDQDKQIRLNRAALAYARRLEPKPEALRFDIVEVIGTPKRGVTALRYHPGAFGLHHGFRYE